MTSEHERGVELIEGAFAAARDAGFEKWRTMTSAVLKNRILDLTERAFDEAEWGADSFRAFLAQFDDLLYVDSSQRPALVTLLEDRGASSVESVSSPAKDLGRHRQIRGDLWNAIMDLGSGRQYGWDGEKAVAVDPGGADMPLLPTLTDEEFRAWRAAFVERQIAAGAEADPLRRWLEQERGMVDLPGWSRIRWVIELKQRVRHRLVAWFDENGLQPPRDLVVDDESSHTDDTSTEALRDLLLAAVRQMSSSELEALQVPAAALLRVTR